jgi:CRISPR type III-A-associated RAMP protein Csm4
MTLALMVKFRPLGPWRSGPDSGAREQADPIYHSDSLYSAVCGAMASLGRLDQWLDATARNPTAPAVRFSSCFPFQGNTRYVAPPRSVWPPPVSAKVRWNGARFVPLDLVDSLLCGDAAGEDRWAVDGPSECLIHPGQRGPFRQVVRSAAAVDRWSGVSEPHRTAGMEFAPGAGLWALASFAGDNARSQWMEPVRSALRLLADSGLGGQRSRGWGRSDAPEFADGALSSLLIPRASAASQTPEADPIPLSAPSAEQAYWLLSLFAPAEADQVAWDRGHYSLTTRGGRVDSPAGSGQLKKRLHMVTEGSVLFASGEVSGAAANVAPDGFPHPVYRAGFAVAIPIPTQMSSQVSS